jgi:hypothetical protein
MTVVLNKDPTNIHHLHDFLCCGKTAVYSKNAIAATVKIRNLAPVT